jgi:hypothetical protein
MLNLHTYGAPFDMLFGIAGRPVMGADLVLLLLKDWDHGTKSGGPGWWMVVTAST